MISFWVTGKLTNLCPTKQGKFRSANTPVLSPSLVTFHYRFTQPAFVLRILPEKVRHLSSFPYKVRGAHDKCVPKNTFLLSLQVSVAQLCLFCGRQLQTLSSLGVGVPSLFFRCKGRTFLLASLGQGDGGNAIEMSISNRSLVFFFFFNHLKTVEGYR